MRPGFTLVETLVALAVFALLAGAGVLILQGGIGSQEATQARLDALAQLERTRALLSADLGQIAPRLTRDEAGQRRLAPFEGGAVNGAPQMRFVRRGVENISGAGRPSLQQIAYGLEENRLVRRAFPALDGAAPGPPQILLDGIEALDIAFLDGANAWSPVWGAERVGLPRAVRLRLTMRDLGAIESLHLTAATAP